MIAVPETPAAAALRAALERVRWAGSIVLFGALPVIVLALLFIGTVEDDTIAVDFRQFYAAGERILDGENPYVSGPEAVTEWGGPFPYPPVPALVATPLTALPLDAAGLLVMAALVVCAIGTLAVLGVRDWRVYGVALLWPPVLSAIQTGNVTLPLALAAALTWRYRGRGVFPAAAVGVSLAAKLFLWPLAVWLAAARRAGAALLAVTIGLALLFFSWALIGFAGLRDYPDVLRAVEDAVGGDSYTLYIVGLDAGLPGTAARGLWLATGLGLLAAAVVAARRGDERRAFIVAVAASLALTPIVWLHYFALLLVVVAVARPRFGVVWFVPLAMVVTPGSGQPTPFETAWTLGAAALSVALAVRAVRAGPAPAAAAVASSRAAR